MQEHPRRWRSIKDVPEGVPVREEGSGWLWQRHEGKVWTTNGFGWYTPNLAPRGLLTEVENPGWWMRLGRPTETGETKA